MQSQRLHGAAVPVGGGSGREGLVSPAGAGSPTSASMSVSRGVSTQPLGIVFQAGDGARMTDSHRATEGCSGIEGAIGGVDSAAHHALYSAPLRRHPFSQTNSLWGSEQWRYICKLPKAVCLTCLACLLQFMLGQCRMWHLLPFQRLQCTPEVLVKPGSTRVRQKPLFKINVWLTIRPNLCRKIWFHRSRMPWLVPKPCAVLDTAR